MTCQMGWLTNAAGASPGLQRAEAMGCLLDFQLPATQAAQTCTQLL